MIGSQEFQTTKAAADAVERSPGSAQSHQALLSKLALPANDFELISIMPKITLYPNILAQTK